MVRYSDELIEEIKNRNDIIDVISQYVVLKTALNFQPVLMHTGLKMSAEK